MNKELLLTSLKYLVSGVITAALTLLLLWTALER
jgi:hypothetical protein